MSICLINDITMQVFHGAYECILTWDLNIVHIWLQKSLIYIVFLQVYPEDIQSEWDEFDPWPWKWEKVDNDDSETTNYFNP